MHRKTVILPLLPLVCLTAYAQEPPPAGAMKYHAALLKSPDNATLFDRFFNAWIDEQPVEALERFLIDRSESKGGADIAVLARFQLRRGLEDAALATLGKAISTRPEDASLPMARAGILLRRLEFAAARKDLASVAAGNDPALALEAAKLTGKSFLREGKPEEALKAWDALLAAHPGDEELLEDLVESAAAEGQNEQAIAYLDTLIAKSADPYRKTLRQLRRAELLARAGKSDDAALAFSAALANVGEGSWLEREILAQFEKLFRSQDRIADLKGELRKMAEANPRRLLVHRQLAKLEADDGETDAAIGRFREVLRRSPGEAELREEFIKLLIDSRRFADAAAELEKMIALAPENAELHLRMAALFAEQDDTAATLASLEKAHTLLGEDEGAGLRIASLMLGYGMGKDGEALLGKLLAAPNASPAPAEALAAEYVRTNRGKDALALLEKAAANAELEALIRITGSISRLGESEKSHDILKARLANFPADPRFLAALSQASLAAAKPAEAVAPAMKLIRLARLESDIRDAVSLASRALAAAEENEKWRDALGKQETLSPAETCLLASLAEAANDFEEVGKLLAESTDPLLIRYHASLLERRGDFTAALSALEALASTEEGRKASFFKPLSELQIRAGKMEEALKTLDEWKLSAPGDRTPWLIASRLLRDSGRATEAIGTTRRALARFADDEDLAASLASLHEAVGAYADAEEIYWRLYDSSPDPVSQSRWAAQLSLLAQRSSTIAELQEKFEERARNNRRSLGPILAQIELARVTQDDVACRDLLQQALRLQPQKEDLRMQLADIEEQAGNAEAANALLKEGLDEDKTGRLRSALAQAYIRQGDVLKGTHMLRSISSDGGSDPRLIESLTTTILNAGMPEEAARFLTQAMPDGGDWRTKYLLASILAEDGREDEALPIFIGLQEAEGDLPGIAANQNQGGRSGSRMRSPLYSEQRGSSRVSALIEANYRIQQNRGGNPWSGRGGGAFQLPSSADEVRLLSFVHLARLASAGGEETEARIRDAGVEGITFAKDLLSAVPNDYSPVDYLDLLEKYPDESGLFQAALQSGTLRTMNGADPRAERLLRKFLKSGELEPFVRMQAAAMMLEIEWNEETIWETYVSAAGDAYALPQAAHMITGILSRQDRKVPDKHRATLAEILLRISADEAIDPQQRENLRLTTFAVLGKAVEWIDGMNAAITGFREKQADALKKMAVPASYNPWQHYGFHPANLPDISSIWLDSLPISYANQIRANGEDSHLSAAALMAHMDAIHSPALRAVIAIKAGETGKAQEILSVPPPEVEKSDFQILKATGALAAKDYPLAFRHYADAEPQHISIEARRDSLLVSIALNMTDVQRKSVEESLRGVLEKYALKAGPQAGDTMAQTAGKLGFPDLAEKFKPAPAVTVGNSGSVKPAGPAVFAPSRVQRNNSPSRQPLSPRDRIRKFAADGKTDAAAREALVYLRNEAKNGQINGRSIRELMDNTGDGTLTALLALTAPDASRSLTRRLFHIEVCTALGKTAEAVSELQELVAERPHDTSVALRLAFALPPENEEQAQALLNGAAASPDFGQQAFTQSGPFLKDRDDARSLAFVERVAGWLEKSPSEDLRDTNLSWISYQSHRFFNGQFGTPNLLQPLRENSQEPDLNARSTKLGRRLAAAMMRHPGLAEEGFRLNLASKAWTDTPEDLDRMARSVLLIAEAPAQMSQPRGLFSFYQNGSYSNSSGADLPEFSTMAWLSGRLGKMKMAELFPPDYLDALSRENPQVGTLATVFATMDGVKQLDAFWESNAMAAVDPISKMFSEAILTRTHTIPGAAGFFLVKIQALEPGSLIDPYGSPGSATPLVKTGFRIAAKRGGKDLDEVCTAIARALYDGKPSWETEADYQKLYQIGNVLNRILGDIEVPLRSLAQTLHTMERLDFPFPYGEQWLNRNLQKSRIKDAQEGIATLGSLGMLGDAKDWKPLAVLVPNTNRDGIRNVLIRERKIIVPSNSLRLDIGKDKFAAALEAHKPQTFGSLISAASVASGEERQRLAAAAFTLASRDFRKMSDKRMEDFTEFSEWLPKDSIAQFPEFFRKNVEEKNKIKLAELLKQLEERKISSRSANDFMMHIPSPVFEIAERDMAKAVEVFLDAEHSYTEALAKGEPLSTATSAEAMVTDRDQALDQTLSYLTSRNNGTPEPAIRFLNAIVASPAAGRFSFGTRSRDTPLLQAQGQCLLRAANNAKPRNRSNWQGVTAQALALPQDLREDALAAAACMAIGSIGIKDILGADPAEKTTGRAAEYRSLLIGALAFASDEPPKRAATSEIITGFLTDGKTKEFNRMQLAFAFVGKAPAILADPSIAAATADLFTNYCAADRSAVNPLTISFLGAILRTEINDANLPHLKRMQAAFWKNADSPKAGGHPAINPEWTKPLFLAAMATGESKAADRLFLALKPSLKGDSEMIVNIIYKGYFHLAAQILPAEGELNPRRRISRNYTEELDEKLAAFRKTDVDQAALLCFETALLTMNAPSGHGRLSTQERIGRLAESYRSHPPKDFNSRVELLSAFATTGKAGSDILSKELAEVADALDPLAVMGEMASTQSGENSLASAKWDILCKAAALRFSAGEAKPAVALSGALVKSAGDRSGYVRTTHRRFLEYMLPATCSAILEETTAAFGELIEPLGVLAVTLSKDDRFDRRQIAAVLALCELLAYWDGKPGLFPPFLDKLGSHKEEHQMRFSFPRRHSPFFSAVLSYHARENRGSSFVSAPGMFIVSFLSHTPIDDLLPADFSWLPGVAAYAPENFLTELMAGELPEGISPAGRALLLHQYAVASANRKGEGVWRDCLAEMPESKPWVNLRTEAACKLAILLLADPEGIPEARKLLSTVNVEDSNGDTKTFYEYLLYRLEKAESPSE